MTNRRASAVHEEPRRGETRCAGPRWDIVTGEYPPKCGGVGDYTQNLARELARTGAEVHIWTPSCGAADPPDDSVTVHRLPGRFGAKALRALDRGVIGRDGRILVQYVPHAFGWKAMNLPFCVWLLSRPKQPVAVMFHEVVFPLSRKQPLRHNLLGVVTRLMALMVARAAGRILVPTPGWEVDLRPILPAGRRIEWMPVSSNVPVIDDPRATAAVRARYAPPGAPLFGHFGPYDHLTTATLADVAARLLADRPEARVLALGENGPSCRGAIERRHPELARRVEAPGLMLLHDISLHLRACDVLIQPYADGASTRRTTLMAGLAHGLPIVTTSGRLTEPLWKDSQAVMLAPWGDVDEMVRLTANLLADQSERARLARAAKELYARRFDIKNIVGLLIGAADRTDLAQPSVVLSCGSQ